ncbi:MAG: hypothetical protein EPO67_11605 [Reyranella sp.]|nr:MAG: hypothetical protein EPO67_11605 [Reyranella sp.]
MSDGERDARRMQASRPFGETLRETPLYLALVVCAGLRVAFYLQHGFVFDVLPQQWQLLDLEVLRLRPLESLNALHAQPPLLNGLLAVALALPPVLTEPFLHVFFLATTVTMVALVFHFLRCFGYGGVASGIGAALFGILPQVLIFEHWFFYPHLEAALLLAAMYFSSRYLSLRATQSFAGLVACLVALALLRALFHLGWVIVALVAIWLASAARHGVRWRDAGIGVVAIAMVFALYAKNYIQFGSFSPSSWPGMNLATIVLPLLPADHGDHPDFVADFKARVARGEFSATTRALAEDGTWTSWAEAAADCGSAGSMPIALCAVRKKAGGDLNYNHHSIPGYSKDLAADARTALAYYWPLYLRRVASSYLTFFGVPSWEDGHPSRAVPRSYVAAWSVVALYDPRAVLAPDAGTRTGWRWALWRVASTSPPHLLLVPLAVMIVMVLATAECLRLVRGGEIAVDWILPALAVVLFLTVPHWVSAYETHRMRYSIEPILFLALAFSARQIFTAMASFRRGRS